MACPGSVQFSEMLPEPPSSVYAEEGTRAHKLLETCLLEQRTPRPDEGDDDQMRECVHEMLEYIGSELRRVDAPWADAEKNLPMPYGDGESGTVDVTIYGREETVVIDLKYGAGEIVRARDNWQGIAYLSAAAATQDFVKNKYTFTIYQPRAGDGRPDSVTYSRDELQHRLWALAFGHQVVLDLDGKPWPEIEASLNPGQKQCRWCAAQTVCPALKRQAYQQVTRDFDGVPDFDGFTSARMPEPKTLTPREISEILQAKPLIEKWLKWVQNFAFNEVKRQVLIPGWKVVQADPTRTWLYEDGELNSMMLSSLTGGALPPRTFMRPPTGVPLTEAEAILKAWASEEAPKGQKRKASQEISDAMAILIDKKSSGALQLVPESDPRPAVNPGSDFAGLSIPEPDGPIN